MTVLGVGPTYIMRRKWIQWAAPVERKASPGAQRVTANDGVRRGMSTTERGRREPTCTTINCPYVPCPSSRIPENDLLSVGGPERVRKGS